MELIHQIVPKIIGEISPIAKSSENKQQGYTFRGIDDVYKVLNLLLTKHGICIVPQVTESSHESFTTKSGALMFRHRCRVRYVLYASDGSHIDAEVEGEGMDSGDKATPKALSTAYKYMAFQVFCIPTGEKIDTENDSPEVVGHGNGHGLAAEDLARIQAETCAEMKKKLEGAADLPALSEVALEVAKAAGEKRLTEGQRLELTPLYLAKKKALTPAQARQ